MSKPTDKNNPFMSKEFHDAMVEATRKAVSEAEALGLPKAYIDLPPLPDPPETRTIYLGRKKNISEEERQKRIDSVNFARGSVRLEGFVLSDEVEALNAKYIAGELSTEEHTAATLALYGVDLKNQ